MSYFEHSLKASGLGLFSDECQVLKLFWHFHCLSSPFISSPIYYLLLIASLSHHAVFSCADPAGFAVGRNENYTASSHLGEHEKKTKP